MSNKRGTPFVACCGLQQVACRGLQQTEVYWTFARLIRAIVQAGFAGQTHCRAVYFRAS